MPRTKVFASTLLVAASLLGFPAFAVDAPETQEKLQATESLRRLQAEWHRAYVVADSARLERLLAPAARVVRSSGVVLERAKVLEYYRSRDKTDLTVVTDDQVTHLADGLALMTSRVTEHERGALSAYRVVDLFERRGETWQLRHSQWTSLPGVGAPVAVDPAALTALAGQYEGPTGRVITVKAMDAGLHVRTASGREYTLLPRTGENFFQPEEPGEWVFPRQGSEMPAYVVVVTGRVATLLRRRP